MQIYHNRAEGRAGVSNPRPSKILYMPMPLHKSGDHLCHRSNLLSPSLQLLFNYAGAECAQTIAEFPRAFLII